MLKFMLNRML